LIIFGNDVTFDAELVGPWVSAKTGGTWTKGRGTAIGRLKDGQLVAGVLYEDWNGANIICHIAGIGSWASRGFLHLIFHYPFSQLGVKRMTAPIAASNAKSINLVTKMGFELECTLAQANPDGDVHIFRIFKEECKYLRGKYEI
jgi:RimJ/RimL family protein N-acetyltransferase